MVGWSAVDFAFNPGNADERGVYLRSWGFELGAEGAAGVATNFSPITQLHDMSYTFSGDVRAVTVVGEIDTGLVEAEIPAQVNPLDERPVVQELALE